MTQNKTIKINLKNLIADLLFASIDKNEGLVKELKKEFEVIYGNQNIIMKNNILKYLLSNNVVKENKNLLEYFIQFQKSN